MLQDPFGNEFCLITELSDEEVRAVEEDFAQHGSGDDEHWRTLAGRRAEAGG